MTIGVFGKLSADKARKLAHSLANKLAEGKDPAEDRQSKRKAPTFGQLLDDFMVEHVEAKRKSSTVGHYRSALKKVPDKLKARKIEGITYSDIARLHTSMKDTPYHANRVVAILSSMFKWCEKRGYRPKNSNPCDGVERFKEKSRKTYLNERQFHALDTAIDKLLAENDISIFQASLIRLLMFTGARSAEIRTLTWDRVDLDNGIIHLGDSKTGERDILLNEQAVEVLREIPFIDGNPHVIVGRKPGTCLVNIRKAWVRICEEAEIEGVRIHDLRHSFASMAVSAGFDLPTIGGLLGHTQAQTTKRYAHLVDVAARKATGEVGNMISKAAKGKGKLVDMNAARKAE